MRPMVTNACCTRRDSVGNTHIALLMLAIIGLLLIVLWVLGLVLHIAGGLIHLLLLLAVVLVVLHFLTGARPAA